MKLTKTVIERIVTSVETSVLPLYRIAASCGITSRTLRNWLRDGEDYQHQINNSEINESDLNTNQKLKLDLFLRVEVARTNVETGYLNRILEIAEKKGDIRAFQWLLKMKHQMYHDRYVNEEDTVNASEPVAVVNLSDKKGGGAKLLNEIRHGIGTNGKEEDSPTDETGDNHRS